MKKSEQIKKIVRKKYQEIAKSSDGCGCCNNNNSQKTAEEIGYSEKEIKETEGANLGLGCGNPVAMSKIKEGDVVLDLGCGAGIDCLLAAKKVGKNGKVIGVDITEEMIKQARVNAKKLKKDNVKFILADIENLPIEDSSIDVIISNCVINLTPDKTQTFNEACRVLKVGGRIYLSDIVLLEELTEKQKNDDDLLSGCVAGALLKEVYIDKIEAAGFEANILFENKEISKQQYQGIALESIGIEAIKI